MSLVHTQIFARAGRCLRSSVCVYQTMCAHPLVAICSTSQQAAVVAAPSIWLSRSAVLVTCPRCPWGKWNLTLVSSPLHTLCRWRCNQLSLPFKWDWLFQQFKTNRGTELQLLLYWDMVRGDHAASIDHHPALSYVSFQRVQMHLIWMISQILHAVVWGDTFSYGNKSSRTDLISELPSHKWRQFICVGQEAVILWAADSR